jgi:hypothetical protein
MSVWSAKVDIKPTASSESPLDARDRALSRVLAELRDGLRHGYFEYTLTCEVVGQERRRMTLRAGKSYQFVISKDECVSSRTSSATPVTGAPGNANETRSIASMTSTRPAPGGMNADRGLLVSDGNDG